MDILIAIGVFITCMAVPYFIFYFINPYKRNFKKGLRLLNEGKNDEAVKAFTICLKKYPDEYYSLCNRGIAYKRLGKYDKAETDLIKAIDIRPEKKEAYSIVSGVYDKQKNYSGIVAINDKAINANPKNVRAFVDRAAGFKEMGKFEPALQDLNMALNLDNLNADALNNSAYIKLQLEDYEGAVADADRALKIEEHTYTYNNRGFAYANLKQFKKAFEDFEKSYELNPNNAYLYLNRGITYFMIEDYKNSEEDLKKAVELDPLLEEEAKQYMQKKENKT